MTQRIKRLIIKWLDQIVWFKRNLVNNWKSTLIETSIADLWFRLTDDDYVKFLVASRLLDVEAYINRKDTSFRFQKELSLVMYPGREFDDAKWSNSFKSLVDSFAHSGYNKSSKLSLDKELRLRNGTHRCALCLHFGISKVAARVMTFNYDLPDFSKLYESNLPQETQSVIRNKMRAIHQMLINDGNGFCAIFIDGSSKLPDWCTLEHECHFHVIDTVQLINGTTIKGPAKGVIVQFTPIEPHYIVSDGTLKLQQLNDFPKNCCIVSNNAIEGKQIYDILKPYFI